MLRVIAMPLKLFIRWTLLSFLMLPFMQISAEEIVYKRFSTRNGMPGSEIYDVHQDRRGFLWFATDKGLCRYDGHNFRVFTTHDGLSENVVFSIHEDRKGVLWFATFTKGVCCWDGQTFVTPGLNTDLLKNLHGNSWVKNIVFDKKNNPWISIKGAAFKTVFTAESGKLKAIKLSNTDSSKVVLLDIDGKFLEVINHDEVRQKVGVRKSGDKYFFYLVYMDFKPVVKLKDGSIIFASAEAIYQFNGKEISWIYALGKECNSIYSDDGEKIWAATSDGVYLFKPGKSAPLAHYFSGDNISSTFRDREGNYWFSSLNAGAFMVPSLDVKFINIPEDSRQKINNLAGNNSGVYFTTFSGKLFKADADYKVSPIRYASENTYVNRLYADKNTLLLTNGYQVDLKTMRSRQWTSNTGKALLRLKNGKLAVGYINGFAIFEGEKLIFNSKDSGFVLRTISFCEDDKGNIWASTLYGLYKIRYSETSKSYKIEKALLDKRVSCMEYTDGMLVVGTTEEGLYFYQNGKFLSHLDESKGLAGNFVSKIYVMNKDTLWVGTHRGISRLVWKNGTYNIHNISRDDGLPANEVNSICYFNNYLWVATDLGLAAFDPEKLIRRKEQYPVYIEGIRINETDTTISSEYTLGYDQRNISISFAGLTLRYPEKILYYYRLEGMNSDWVSTRERNLQFVNLPPGSYKLRLAAATLDNPLLRGPETVVDFLIKKHYTQSTWFIALIAFTAIGLILLIMYQYIRNQQQRVRNKEELILAEQKALRAQMNPHFIFNAMNSIQHYLYENDRESAGIFLSKFSSLMRVILENSGQSLITLEEELSCAKQYLELERLRFANRFNFNIEVDDDISLSDTQIPSMMIQPFLENAIWHGIMPRQTEGDLQFRISRKDNYIFCCIDDNGIGRRLAEAMKDNRSMHKSSALKNIRERISLINAVYKMDMKLEIDDKENEAKESGGTRVILSYKIPGHDYN